MYLAGVAVEGDGEAEGVEDAAAGFGVGVGERLAEVGERVEQLAGAVEVERAVAGAAGCRRREHSLDLVRLCLERLDPRADEVGIDTGLDGAELELDPLLHVGALLLDAGAVVALVAADLLREYGVLAAEARDPFGAEDVVGEEAVDRVEEEVFADVLPLAVAERFGGFVAVGDAVGAGVVGDAFAFLAVHAQRVVAGGAVDDPAQLVEAALPASPFGAFAAPPFAHLGGGALEPVVRDEWLVAAFGFDPVAVVAANDRAFAELGAAEVEPVPVEAAGIDGVGEDGADRGLRPFAGGVAAAVDVPRWRRAAGAVEVVGDLLEAESAQVALEDLDDHGRLLGVGDESRLLVAGASASRVGVGFALEPVAVGGAAAVAVALARVFDLAASRLAAELLDFELVEGLEDVAHEPPFGTGLVASGDGVVDVDVGAGEFAFVRERAEEVAREPGGGVDDDGVEAACFGVACFADEVAPGGAVAAASALLVGELGDDVAAELVDLPVARLSLRRE